MPEPAAFDAAHIDAAFIVVVKPAGLLSVPGRGETRRDCLAARVRCVYDDALSVHRLDMATSGLMLFARGTLMQRQFSIAFARREMAKRYVAVVHGRVAQTHGEIDLALSADWPNRPRQQVDLAHGKPSLTRYRVLSFNAERDTTRLELEPVTGRAHQLRVHLQALGHPILGDALYAPSAVCARADRLLLHAASLRFTHPLTSEPVEVASAPPF